MNLCLGCMEESGEQGICSHCGWVEGSAPLSPLHLPAGTLLREKYLVGRPLGQSSFSTAYLAWDINLGLKLEIWEYMPKDYAFRLPGEQNTTVEPGEKQRIFDSGLEEFLREARILARFEGHPGIVSVRDYFAGKGTAYLVTNCLEGLTLEGFLKRVGRLTFHKTRHLFMPVMDALREIHELGLLHRDISPDTIFITGPGRAVLVDFGGVRHTVCAGAGSPAAAIRPCYAPEEQYHAPETQGPWSDVYGLAATIYKTITGELPAQSPLRLAGDTLLPPSRLGVKIGEKEECALLKAMAVRAEDRFQSVEEFQQILLEGMPEQIHY